MKNSAVNSVDYGVIVIGAGHAGIEAALASSRMGVRTLMITLDVDRIGQMSCNPAIGGIGKGHLTREVDALGGEMGRAIDATGIQFRKLNTRKGAAVRATRAQADRWAYRDFMIQAITHQENLDLIQDRVDKISIDGTRVAGIVTVQGRKISARCIVVTTGTFMKGLLHYGAVKVSGGRAGDGVSTTLSDCLNDLGHTIGRLKTGTTPRLDTRTIDWSQIALQHGDSPAPYFSFISDSRKVEQIPCGIVYTNSKTNDIIRRHMHESPLYSGEIKGLGPRYCPSIEDKVVKFPDRERHQVFLEPEGRNSIEIYPNGLSTSLPVHVQDQYIHSISGLESARIIRPGYAVEYDYCDPQVLSASLQSRVLEGLFLAGQINGTTGYEEAAAQGIIAGINAASVSRETPLLELGREQAYIGVMIDDLTQLGTSEPYRMFTSRAEYRLLLREDNADLRLTPLGISVGTVSEERAKKYGERYERLEAEKRWVETSVRFSDWEHESGRDDIVPWEGAETIAMLLRRSELTMDDFIEVQEYPFINHQEDRITIEANCKYAGYLGKQVREIEQIGRIDGMDLPAEYDFAKIPGLRKEIVEKLVKHKPATLGEARRISGVTLSSILLLYIHLRKKPHV